MIKTFPVEVGQTVYMGVFRGLAATMPAEQILVGTVSKIGRKYMFIDTGNKTLRFEKNTFNFAPAETDPYDTRYILFWSEGEYADEMLRRSYIHAIRNSKFTDIFSSLEISLDAAKAIYEILKAEGVKNLRPVANEKEKECKNEHQ